MHNPTNSKKHISDRFGVCFSGLLTEARKLQKESEDHDFTPVTTFHFLEPHVRSDKF